MEQSKRFLDDFSTNTQAINAWAWYSGDGSATMDFQQGEGFASILVDATGDRRNIWWALIRREVTGGLDLDLLNRPGHALRVEAKVRSSHAPRRVNLHLRTQRTVDNHSHLMEFDIPDTTHWHTISMTTQGFDAVPGDQVFGQMALMDWGLEKYRVDVAYYKVEVVDLATCGADQGEQTPYHPPIPGVDTFAHQVVVAHDSLVDTQYPDVNFNRWGILEPGGKVHLLTVNGTQCIIMRWDLAAFAGKRAAGSGLLELTTHSVQHSFDDLYEFGKIRVTEILGGDAKWDQEDVTCQSLCQGKTLDEVFNTQMIYDTRANDARNGKTWITISRPVLQRLLDGKTLGLAVRPLGAVHAAFYAMDNQDRRRSPRLLFNLQEP
ncbi:MAG: hypothetical protein ACOYYS_20320 [Chloroflexota bacterium]